MSAEEWWSENKKRRRSGMSLACGFEGFAMAERERGGGAVCE